MYAAGESRKFVDEDGWDGSDIIMPYTGYPPPFYPVDPNYPPEDPYGVQRFPWYPTLSTTGPSPTSPMPKRYTPGYLTDADDPRQSQDPCCSSFLSKNSRTRRLRIGALLIFGLLALGGAAYGLYTLVPKDQSLIVTGTTRLDVLYTDYEDENSPLSQTLHQDLCSGYKTLAHQANPANVVQSCSITNHRPGSLLIDFLLGITITGSSVSDIIENKGAAYCQFRDKILVDHDDSAKGVLSKYKPVFLRLSISLLGNELHGGSTSIPNCPELVPTTKPTHATTSQSPVVASQSTNIQMKSTTSITPTLEKTSTLTTSPKPSPTLKTTVKSTVSLGPTFDPTMTENSPSETTHLDANGKSTTILLPTVETRLITNPSLESTSTQQPTLKSTTSLGPTVAPTMTEKSTSETTSLDGTRKSTTLQPTVETTLSMKPSPESTSTLQPTLKSTTSLGPTLEPTMTEKSTAGITSSDAARKSTTPMQPTVETTLSMKPSLESTSAQHPTLKSTTSLGPTLEPTMTEQSTAGITSSDATKKSTKPMQPTVETTLSTKPSPESVSTLHPTLKSTTSLGPTLEPTMTEKSTAGITSSDAARKSTTPMQPTVETTLSMKPSLESTSTQQPTLKSTTSLGPTLEPTMTEQSTAGITSSDATKKSTTPMQPTVETTLSMKPSLESTSTQQPTLKSTTSLGPTFEPTSSIQSVSESTMTLAPTAYTTTETDPCAQDPCANNGTCIAQGANFTCQCQPFCECTPYRWRKLTDLCELDPTVFDCTEANKETYYKPNPFYCNRYIQCSRTTRYDKVCQDEEAVVDPSVLPDTIACNHRFLVPCPPPTSSPSTVITDISAGGPSITYESSVTSEIPSTVSDPCTPNPCLNGGLCEISGTNFTCQCVFCECTPDEWRNVTSTCDLEPGTFECTDPTNSHYYKLNPFACNKFYWCSFTTRYDQTCGNPDYVVDPSTVQTQPQCKSPSDFGCELLTAAPSTQEPAVPTTFSGGSHRATSSGETLPSTTVGDPCAPNPCLNGGTCVASGEEFTCQCLFCDCTPAEWRNVTNTCDLEPGTFECTDPTNGHYYKLNPFACNKFYWCSLTSRYDQFCANPDHVVDPSTVQTQPQCKSPSDFGCELLTAAPSTQEPTVLTTSPGAAGAPS